MEKLFFFSFSFFLKRNYLAATSLTLKSAIRPQGFPAWGACGGRQRRGALCSSPMVLPLRQPQQNQAAGPTPWPQQHAQRHHVGTKDISRYIEGSQMGNTHQDLMVGTEAALFKSRIVIQMQFLGWNLPFLLIAVLKNQSSIRFIPQCVLLTLVKSLLGMGQIDT